MLSSLYRIVHLGLSMFLHKVFILNTNPAICLPKVLAKQYGITKGDFVMVKAHKDGILIQRVIEVGSEARISTVRHDPRAKT